MSYSNYSNNNGQYNGYGKRQRLYGSYNNGNGSNYRHVNLLHKSSFDNNGSIKVANGVSSTDNNTPTAKRHTGMLISNIAKNDLEGTDINSGINPHDLKFAVLSIHSDYLKPVKGQEPSKTYKVSYDPELDKSLSKADKKSRHIKLKYSDPNHHGLTHDPRITFQGGLESYLHKPNKRSKKFPFKQLPQTKFVFDKDSLGPPPLLQLVMWDLPSTTSEIYLSNFFKSYGSPIKDLRFINDSENGAPLGVVTFEFQGSKEKASRLAEKVVKESKNEGIYIDGVNIKIDLNDHEGKLLEVKVKDAESKLRAFHLKLQEERRKQNYCRKRDWHKRIKTLMLQRRSPNKLQIQKLTL